MIKKKYLTPDAKVIQMKHAEIICTSNGTFNSPQSVSKGDDDDWETTDLDW